MLPADIPTDEQVRLRALRRYAILDTEPEVAFDDVAALARQLADTPIALVSLVDEGRQWFKARLGLEAPETTRDVAFCAHAILDPDKVFEVPDATVDPRFADNPLVTGGPGIQFYAGAPLVTPDGHALGTLCVIDTEPRSLSEAQRAGLQRLARTVVAHFEARRVAFALLSVTDVLDELRVIGERQTRHEVADGVTALLERVVGADGAGLRWAGDGAPSGASGSAGAQAAALRLASEREGAGRGQDLHLHVEPTGSSVLVLPLHRHDAHLGDLYAWWDRPIAALEPTAIRVLEVLGHEAAFMLARLQGTITLTNEATTDSLTGLANRRQGQRLLAAMPAGSTVVLLDLDHFKSVNDTHGHAAGDAVLRHVGESLRAVARTTDLLCRWGGEEFLLAFPRTGTAEAQHILARLRQRLAAGEPAITFSAGLATRHPDLPPEITLAAADVALYEAKASGRARDRVSSS